MTSNYLKHVRSLQELHEIIEHDHALGSMEAVERLAQDVQAVGEKIAEDAQRMAALVNTRAEAESMKLTAKTAIAVSKINNDAAKAAANLIRQVPSRENAKNVAIAANKILKEAEKVTAKLNRQAEKAVGKVAKRAETAAANVKRVAEAANRDLTDAGNKATESIARASKDALTRFPASENGSLQGDEFVNESRLAAANVIKVLAQAAERMNQAAELATAELQAVTDEAVTWVQRAAEEATATIVVAIEAANKTILEITQKAIIEIVGKEKLSLFDLEPLKKRWSTVG